MIPDADARTVLCYGDSNTNGQRSEDVVKGRLPAGVRWTGRLQRLLGAGFAVIEEGLGGRTTAVEDPFRPGRDGRRYFGPCIQSHEPLDRVVIMLGTADLKSAFGRAPKDIAGALDGYFGDLATLLRSGAENPPDVILLSPVPVDDTKPLFAELNGRWYDAGSAAGSRLLAGEFARLADRHGAVFLDAADAAHVGADGIHLSLDSHEALARLVADTIIGRARTARCAS